MSTVEEQRGGNGYVGRRMKRKEDPRFITGRGQYVDDIVLPGLTYAAFVRSTEAHARILSIDKGEAEALPGIHAVFTGEDMADLGSGIPMAWVPPGVEVLTPEHWPLARGEVNHVGEPVAVVIGDDKYAVVDATERVVVLYDPLPAVVDPEKALEDGSPLVHEDFGTNKTHEWGFGTEDIDAALAACDEVLELRIVNHRTAGTAIEPRGVMADFRAGALTLWSSTQIPHLVRLFLAGELNMSEDRIRVIGPDVGGAFGSKLNHYGEEIVCAWASRKIGRPVKWIETRSENLLATTHGRDLICYGRMGASKDGTIQAFHAKLVADLGATYQLLTPYIPCFAAFVMSGCYKIPAVRTDIVGVFTNKMATDAVRGAGRPEATHMIEVMIEQLADRLGMDRLELRRKNFIPKEDFPAEVSIGLVYDSGDYHGTLDKLLTHIDVDAFKREQEELRGQGIYRGLGFSTYVEICGLAPSRVAGPGGVGLQAGFWESATVRVHLTGSATVFTGTMPHGQGHETGFAQIVADRIGTSPDNVEVVYGDTDTGPMGMGTYGSRSLSVGGESCARAAKKVQAKARALAAHLLEAAVEDIEFADNQYRVRGAPEKSMTLADIALAAYIPEDIPEGMEPGLEETAFFDPENFVWPFGAHAAIVDVDIETGKVKLVRYVAVDDCGPAINPLLIEGQVHGGITHGVAQALYEQVAYDSEGQLVTGSFVDYALPTAAELPSFETDRTETPSPVNELGVKGVGEAGTIASSPTIVNAVVDALRPVGVTYMDMPLTPVRVWQAIQRGGGS